MMVRLFGVKLNPNYNKRLELNDAALTYVFYDAIGYQDWLFHIWYTWKETHGTYSFSAYKGGDIVELSKDVRFNGLHSLRFKRSDSPDWEFKSLNDLVSFITISTL